MSKSLAAGGCYKRNGLVWTCPHQRRAYEWLIHPDGLCAARRHILHADDCSVSHFMSNNRRGHGTYASSETNVGNRLETKTVWHKTLAYWKADFITVSSLMQNMRGLTGYYPDEHQWISRRWCIMLITARCLQHYLWISVFVQAETLVRSIRSLLLQHLQEQSIMYCLINIVWFWNQNHCNGSCMRYSLTVQC